jgi:hypothetical protein
LRRSYGTDHCDYKQSKFYKGFTGEHNNASAGEEVQSYFSRRAIRFDKEIWQSLAPPKLLTRIRQTAHFVLRKVKRPLSQESVASTFRNAPSPATSSQHAPPSLSPKRRLSETMLTETTLPSEIDLPKAVDKFRNYEDSNRHDVVSNHYKLMRTHQTLDFVNRMLEKYSFQKPRQRMTIHEAFKKLEHYVDCSDPDVRWVLNLDHFCAGFVKYIVAFNFIAFPTWCI